ncbi:MAG TPA: nucleoside monophosphate kinase [Bryobacteraceae bacterium]|nr:nucleoside monophosphate kinase [Bryobacteraceae bacterium]
MFRFLLSVASAAVIACEVLASPIALSLPQPGPVILVLGPPGSGKTVNAKKISGRYGIPAISMSDLLKEAGGWGKAGSRKTLRAPIESGDLLSDEVSVQLLDQRLGKSDANKGFVLDGFPLSAGQADHLESVSRERGFREPIVVHLAVSDSTATQRMLKRRRADDKPETIERRLAEYHAQAKLVLERYPQVVTIEATGTPDEVWTRVEQALDTLLPDRGR